MKRIKSLLCPVDFSEYSQRAVRYAVSLGLHFGARLLVQHVYPPVQTAYYGYALPSTTGPEFDENLRQQALAALRKFAAENIQDRLVHEEILTMGTPAPAIVDAAEEKSADLIVMGTHGRSGFERFMLGSVADKVIRKAHCPVLAVREIAHRKKKDELEEVHYQTLLVALDLSEQSEHTLAYAAELAKEFNSKLIAIHVVEPNRYPMLDPNYATVMSDYLRDLQKNAAAKMGEMMESVAPKGQAVERVVSSGRGADEILALAKERRADLIVMGARDSWMTRLMTVGTTAHRVLSHADCPVWVLRGSES